MNTIDYTQLKQELVKELALEGLSPEKQEELLGKMLEALLKRIFMGTMDRLGEKGIEDYEKLIGSNPEEKQVAEFLTTNIPEYDQLVNSIIEQFKKDVKAVAAV